MTALANSSPKPIWGKEKKKKAKWKGLAQAEHLLASTKP
jgi:hypothetical protein